VSFGAKAKDGIQRPTGRTADDFQPKYVAGDAKRGASLIVWAVAEGRKAAHQIDLDLTVASLQPT